MSTCRQLDSSEAQGLIFVYSEPGPNVTVEEYNDWYDNEHAPPRLTVPGVLTSARYKAIDSKVPSWFAIYDVTSPDVAVSPEYKALRTNASERENKLMSNLAVVNRRVYSHVLTCVHPEIASSSLPGKYKLIVHMKVTLEGEDEFNKWYNEEHMALVSRAPGWLRGKRFKLVESIYRGAGSQNTEDERPGVEYVAIHDVARDDFMSLPEITEAMQTPWRERAMKSVISREVRLFEQYKVFKRSEIMI